MTVQEIETKIAACKKRILTLEEKIRKTSKELDELTDTNETLGKNMYRISDAKDELLQMTNAAYAAAQSLRVMSGFKEQMQRIVAGNAYEQAVSAVNEDRKTMQRQIDSLLQQKTRLRQEKQDAENELNVWRNRLLTEVGNG